MATFQRVAEQFPRVKQAVITCNKDGTLARLAGQSESSLCVLLPDETNDKSLAMTSSFSSLALAGLCLGFADSFASFEPVLDKAVAGAARVMAEYGGCLSDFAQLPFTRACYLGSNTLLGCMQEARLKMQEMTAGRVVAAFDSFLGLRHGPQVFVNGECVVIASLSSVPSVQRYEMDLLRELKAKKQGIGTLILCAKAGKEVRELSDAVIESFRQPNHSRMTTACSRTQSRVRSWQPSSRSTWDSPRTTRARTASSTGLSRESISTPGSRARYSSLMVQLRQESVSYCI